MKASDLNPDSEVDPPESIESERTGCRDPSSARRMRRLINRLLDEAPKLESKNPYEEPTPAMEASVTIRGMAHLQGPLSGALSITPEGTLKLMVHVPGKAGDEGSLMEVFFDYADVNTIAVERKVHASVGPRIIQAS